MHRSTFASLIVLTLLTTTVAGAPSQAAEGGLTKACERAQSARPCEHLRVIRDVQVGAGQTVTYSNGTYQAQGDIEVLPGGAVVVDNATLRFSPDSVGFVVRPEGALVVKQSRLEEAAEGSEFGIDANLGSSLDLVRSEVRGGSGVRLATDDARIHENILADIPVALRNEHVSVRVHHNQFLGNGVSVNNTGGAPRLDNNTFQGGSACVRDWLSDPVVVHNTFRGCHIGIYHHRSESVLSFNDMEDDLQPPGGGIMVVDTMSPTIEGNNISRYGTGIIIKNARAYVRNNSVHHNYGHGIHVVSNSAPMDIMGNHIYANGGNGILLAQTTDVDVHDNRLEDNGASGFISEGAQLLDLEHNHAEGNGGVGFGVMRSPGAILIGNNATENSVDGFVLDGSNGTALVRNVASGNGGNGIAVIFSQSVQITGGSSSHSGQQGYYFGTVQDLWVEQANASHNAGGFVFADVVNLTGLGLAAHANDAAGIWLLRTDGYLGHAEAIGNAADGFLTMRVDDTRALSLGYARAIANGGAGLRHAQGANVTATQGWWQDNADAGVRNDVAEFSLDARYGYWGSPSGPTHPYNEGGDGDAVVGDVLYEPFAEAPPTTPVYAID